MAIESLIQSFLTLASVVAAGISAKAAFDTVKETRAASEEGAERNEIAEGHRRVLIRPHVVVYLRPGKTYDDFKTTTLYVHNVGPGAARAVEVEVLKGGEFVLAAGKRLDEWGVIREGVNVLPPDDMLQTTFAVQPLEEGEVPEILLEVRYRDIEGRSYEAERFSLSLTFLGNTVGPTRTTRSDDPGQRMARSLEKIAQHYP